MNKERIKLNDKQIDAIKDYLGKRLASYGVAGYKLEIKETPTLTYSYLISQELSKEVLGIFQHALLKCEFKARAWGYKKQIDELYHKHLIQCGLSYEHFGGGTNGCDMNIEFYVFEDGKIVEMYK